VEFLLKKVANAEGKSKNGTSSSLFGEAKGRDEKR
jgi:hypothetical protein